MEKRKIIDKIPLKEDKLLVSQVLDKVLSNRKTGRCEYSYFLDTRQSSLLSGILRKENIDFTLEFFQDDCERSILKFGEDDTKKGIICYRVKQNGKIRHQDVLGSLFALGLKQEMIGDVFVEEDYVYFMVLETVKQLIESELTKFGSYSIKLEEIENFTLKEEHFISQIITVSSLRLDVVLCRLLNLSRSQVEELFIKKKVLLNYLEPNKVHTLLKEDDILSIRGYGKYKITDKKNITRSDKIRLEVLKYK